MIVLLIAFTLLNVLGYSSLATGWKRIPTVHGSAEPVSFSILVPVRNESKNISNLLECLSNQAYPKARYEVLVIDDFSSDDTPAIVKRLAQNHPNFIRLIALTDKSKQGKKHALTAGVEVAKFDVLLTTDADCSMGVHWLSSFANTFHTEKTNMVAGPVTIIGDGLFSQLQQVEFSGLMGFGAVTIHQENPSMCSGANLAFRKAAFLKVGGYTNNLFTPSGDDEFLLYGIMKKFPQTVHFLKSKQAVVTTGAHQDLRSFLNQRTRWTSKWKYNKNWKVRVAAILFFFDYLIFYIGLFTALLGTLSAILFTSIFITRYVIMWVFVGNVNQFMTGKRRSWTLLIFQIIYPLHVLLMGMSSIFGSYTWKGRKYK